MKKIFVFLLCCLTFVTASECRANNLEHDEIIKIAQDAYTYAFPLVIMDLTSTASTNVSGDVGAPLNQFDHKGPSTAKDKLIVRPNVDTLYSFAFLDLSEEPLVLSKPDTNKLGVYCSIAILDAYTNCNEIILGTGGEDDGEADEYLLHGPGYVDEGKFPELVKVSIPTNMAWIMVRTEYDDIDANSLRIPREIQNKFSLVPLSKYDDPGYTPPTGSYDPEKDFVPLRKIQGMDVEDFFNAFNELSALYPGTSADKPALDRFAEINVGPDLTFELSKFPPETQQALLEVPGLVLNGLSQNSSYTHIVNNWLYPHDDIARFGTNYEFRAIIALTGIGANPVEMAVYPSIGVDKNRNRLDGNNSYVIRFEKGQLPPCDAFWSITAYDEDGFLIDNPLNKYAIRDKDEKNWLYNPDGSVEFYLQSESPGKDLEFNWLPVPKGIFRLTKRIYLPDSSVLNFSWQPPHIVQVNDDAGCAATTGAFAAALLLLAVAAIRGRKR